MIEIVSVVVAVLIGYALGVYHTRRAYLSALNRLNGIAARSRARRGEDK